MNNIEPLTLIEGQFNAEEAKEILMNAFSAKIKFHEMKNFSAQLRFGKDNEPALKRIAELKATVERLSGIIAAAGAGNRQLIITSVVHIALAGEHSPDQ